MNQINSQNLINTKKKKSNHKKTTQLKIITQNFYETTK